MKKIMVSLGFILAFGGVSWAASPIDQLSKPLANCMPALMKHGEKLKLTPEQLAKLEEWRAGASKQRTMLEQQAVEARAALRDASFSAAPLPVRSGLAQLVGEKEAQLVMVRSNCVVFVKSVLTAAQMADLQKLNRADMAAQK